MKKFVLFFLVFSLSLLPVFADELDTSIDDLMTGVFDLVDTVIPSDVFEDDSQEQDIVSQSSVTNNNLLVVDRSSDINYRQVGDALYEAILRAQAEQIDEYSEISDISVSPLWTGDTGSTVIPSGNLRSVLTSLIGPYSPVVVQYQYTNGTNTQYLREIMPDYVWMISAAMFALVLYCVFRLWGAILCKR